MEQSPRLSLSYVAPAQAQKHVTVNETFRRLDALVQLTVRSRNVSAEPAGPAEGDAYILPPAASGAAWDGFAPASLAVYQDGAWAEIAPAEGVRAYVIDEGALTVFDGAAWQAVSSGAPGSSGGGGDSAPRFGVNTAADDTNRLAVKSDAVLFNHDDVTPGNDDCRVKINKKTPPDTASLLFQTGASGRAEFGLTGDDDFSIKTSADGSSWTTAMKVDASNGRAFFPDRMAVGAGAAAIFSFEVHSTDPVILLKDTNGVGGGSSGFFSFRDSAGVQNAFLGYGSSQDSHFSFFNALSGGHIYFYTAGALRGRFDGAGGLVIGAPSGGARGAGTVNAQALYDDNALLSCYVFDQALDGAIDPAKWDAMVPDRIMPAETASGGRDGAVARRERREERLHEPARKFSARLGGAHDPLTLDGYARHWREKRHLTSMPNEAAYDPEQGLSTGEWVQRLVETVEIQAVLIEALNARVKKIEARAGGAKAS